MKTNLYWMAGVMLLFGCPSDDSPSGETEDGTGSTGASMSASGSASQSGSGTTPATDSMSTTEDTTTTGDTSSSSTGDTDGTVGTMTDTDTDAGTDTDTDGSSSSGTAGGNVCEGYEAQKECEADKACDWLGNDQGGFCIDPEDPPCDAIPLMFCENIDGCVVEDMMCVPA
jgi:hypothetical protein